MKTFRLSLRARVALGVALPIFIVLAFLSFFNYTREYQLLDEQARLDAVQLGDMMIHSLNHAMLTKEGEHIISSIADVSKLENVQHIQIVGNSGVVMADTSNQQGSRIFSRDDTECISCHRIPVSERPRVIPLEEPTRGWRISAPINNIPECYECHDERLLHLGVLLMDISLTGRQEQLLGDLQVNLLISVISTIFVSLMSYALIHRLVVRRVENFQRPLAEYANGNFDSRMPITSNFSDELGELAGTFNQMADELERHARENLERQQFRERAIVEERERIARELHDGFAQVLGYVNTKVMAVRLLVKNKKLADADRQLEHLETAAKGLFTDVREAILGLKMAGLERSNLIKALRDYLQEYERLSGIATEFTSSSVNEDIKFSPEHELHIFRIVQESLNNVRKHSKATRVSVRISELDGTMVFHIMDNGVGFDHADSSEDDSKFGLKNMKDRASEIGATFQISSDNGKGTSVLVTFPIIDLEITQ
jgi:signal transduction histidine kinase